MCASIGATGAKLTAGMRDRQRQNVPRAHSKSLGATPDLESCSGARPTGTPRNPIRQEPQLHSTQLFTLPFLPPAPAFGPRPPRRITWLAPQLLAPSLCLGPNLRLRPLQHFSGSSASLWPCLYRRVYPQPNRWEGPPLSWSCPLEPCPGTDLTRDGSAAAPAFIPSENPTGSHKCSPLELHEIQYFFPYYKIT